MFSRATHLSFIIFSVFCACTSGVTIDCQRPPQLVDPASCCQDGGRDAVMDNCAKRFGITGQPTDPPPSVEAATCLAECVLTDLKYMQPKTEVLLMDVLRADLTQKFSNDTAFVKTMVDAFVKCQPSTQRKMEAIKQMPLANASIQRGCSPFAGILLGCTYMEYFKNCPAHRWSENAQCAQAKQFVQQCGLGA